MRLRILFHKTEAMRFTGHLDLHKAWERALRRAGLPLAYSQGFHPQPKINLACALPLGFTSECELVDINLEQELALGDIYSRLAPAMPPGIRIVEIQNLPVNAPALQTEVQSAEYRITLLIDTPGLEEQVEYLLASETLPRTRRGKGYDLRPLVERIEILSQDGEGHARLAVHLAAREGATGRPEELVAELGYNPFDARYHRTRLVRQKTEEVAANASGSTVGEA